jgi:hypothetical protein
MNLGNARYNDKNNSSQEPRVYEAEWDFAGAVKFKHYAIIHISSTFLSSG